MISYGQLEAWLREASRGDRQIYYLGYLAADRVKKVTDLNSGKQYDVMVEPAESIGRLMMDAREQGKVELFQTKVDQFEYRYWAVKL